MRYLIRVVGASSKTRFGMTIEDPIKCFACGGKYFVRDCPNPDERKGKGKGKGKDKGKAQGKANDGNDGANGVRSIYEFDIKSYWQKAGAKGCGKSDKKAVKGEGNGEREGPGQRNAGEAILEMRL